MDYTKGLVRTISACPRWHSRLIILSDIVPMLLETSLLSIFVLVALDYSSMRYGGRIPSTGILGLLAYATVALILNLPAVVITYRLVSHLSM